DLWTLGVGIVVCGQYFGWNAGLLGGGPVGMLLASLIVCLLFLVWVLTLAVLAVAMPRAGGPLDYGHPAGGPWLVAGLAALILYILTMACLIRLRRREPELFDAYRAPLGWLLPAAVVLLSGFAIFVYAGIEHGETVLILGAA